MTDFVYTITNKRRGLGLTQEQLAIKIGVNRITIIRWESKKRDIPLTKLLLICKELKLRIKLNNYEEEGV